MPDAPDARENREREDERWRILGRLEDWFEIPMVILGFAWLVLLIIELTHGLTPLLQAASTVIWVLFVMDFGLRFVTAPRKWIFLRSNWLTAISLMLPALRIFRLFRALRVLRLARTARGTRLLTVIGSLNRGMRSLRASFTRRGIGYLVALTVVVALVSAAAMYAFENNPNGTGLDTYPEALWWTGMLLTTLGSEYWPRTGEGRVLAFLLSVYAVGVFGYLTASLATFFIGKDAESQDSEVAGAAQITALQAEVAALREEIRALMDRTTT